MVVLVGSTGPVCASVFGYACRLVCCGECRRHFEAASECSRRRDRLLDPFSATRRNGVRGNGKGGIYICSAYSYLEGLLRRESAHARVLERRVSENAWRGA